MPAHLGLIVDNTETNTDTERLNARKTGGECSTEHPVAPASGTRGAAQWPSGHWVHTFWRPKGAPRRAVGAPRMPRRAAAAQASEAAAVRKPSRLRVLGNDRGAVTAEYAIVILAAVAFAGLLVAIMRSGEIRQMLVDLVQGALGSAG